MKVALVVLLLATPAFAQDQAAIASAACGPKGVTFDVKEDNTQHALTRPAPGKALVYIIQKDALACPGAWCVMRIGMDGAWVGSFKKTPHWPYARSLSSLNSYFPVSVEPGEHHVCASAQLGKEDLIVLTRFTAEVGKVYFLGIHGFNSDYSHSTDISPMDSDEAKYLIATSPLSVSTPSK